MLPPSKDLFFGFNDTSNSTDKTVKEMIRRKMFLGGNEQIQAWAYLRLYPKKSSDVYIFLESRDPASGTIKRREIAVPTMPYPDMSGTEFMYPFEVFRQKYILPDERKKWRRTQLNLLIQVYFLEAGQIDTVWAKDCEREIKMLTIAIDDIWDAYNDPSQFPNGK
jgi:hypothetical protein